MYSEYSYRGVQRVYSTVHIMVYSERCVLCTVSASGDWLQQQIQTLSGVREPSTSADRGWHVIPVESSTAFLINCQRTGLSATQHLTLFSHHIHMHSYRFYSLIVCEIKPLNFSQWMFSFLWRETAATIFIGDLRIWLIVFCVAVSHWDRQTVTVWCLVGEISCYIQHLWCKYEP